MFLYDFQVLGKNHTSIDILIFLELKTKLVFPVFIDLISIIVVWEVKTSKGKG